MAGDAGRLPPHSRELPGSRARAKGAHCHRGEHKEGHRDLDCAQEEEEVLLGLDAHRPRTGGLR